MVLYVIAPGKFYFQIRFNDIPPEYILGGRCILCGHTGPVNRIIIEHRWGADCQLRHVDDHLRCFDCGNTVANHFTVYGRRLTKQLPPLPEGVVDGVEPPSKRY